ncbi:MAG: hypothetical protein AB7F32_07500 [Victivallaceae bacterium]
MLKLNASYSKKVPAEGEYSSQSYHACIEVELPDGLSQPELQSRIHATFDLVRNSVEAELGEKTPRKTGGFQPPNRPFSGPLGGSSQEALEAHPASPKQLTYLLDLARQRGVAPQQLAGRFQLTDVRGLTRRQCSELIKEFSGRAA